MKIAELYELYKQHPVVTTDSRKCPQGALFFALKGTLLMEMLLLPKLWSKGALTR